MSDDDYTQGFTERRRSWSDYQEWRIEISDQFDKLTEHVSTLTQRVIDLELQQADIRNSVAENTALTRRVGEDTADLVEWTKASQGAFKVLVILGRVAKWGASLAAAIGAAYAAWHQIK